MDGNGERGGWALIGSDPVTMDVADDNQDAGLGREEGGRDTLELGVNEQLGEYKSKRD